MKPMLSFMELREPRIVVGRCLGREFADYPGVCGLLGGGFVFDMSVLETWRFREQAVSVNTMSRCKRFRATMIPFTLREMESLGNHRIKIQQSLCLQPP
jgi:hypothetical protein